MSMEKGHLDGACYNYGKTGDRSKDWWSERSKGDGNVKNEQKGKGDVRARVQRRPQQLQLQLQPLQWQLQGKMPVRERM